MCVCVCVCMYVCVVVEQIPSSVLCVPLSPLALSSVHSPPSLPDPPRPPASTASHPDHPELLRLRPVHLAAHNRDVGVVLAVDRDQVAEVYPVYLVRGEHLNTQRRVARVASVMRATQTTLAKAKKDRERMRLCERFSTPFLCVHPAVHPPARRGWIDSCCCPACPSRPAQCQRRRPTTFTHQRA